MCPEGRCEHHSDPVATDRQEPDAGGLDRRRLLMAAATGAAAITLAPVTFTQGRASAATAKGTLPTTAGDVTRVVTGHLETGAADFVYLPVEVPKGVQKIAVEYSYDKPSVPAGTPANSCDIGVFDQRGTKLGGRGFRGWSGGFRTSFEISNTEATPGYLPGPVQAGTWNIVLGPYQVAPQGMNYQVKITLTFGEPGPGFVPNYPPRRAKGRGRTWYRGDGHLHTVYSDGKRLPAEVATGAREAGLELTAPADAPVDVRLEVSGVPNGTVRFITDEGQMHQESLDDGSGTGTVVWRTTTSLAAYVRAEVRHPMADGSPGHGNTMGPALMWGPMAALTNPIFFKSA